MGDAKLTILQPKIIYKQRAEKQLITKYVYVRNITTNVNIK